ncbi:hypothetical protein GIB67_021874 [Kingdonia uniflora]|uniref:Mono-/di-acylglycerol lipase n=1 Tax=Kingdonia uniflora TaxID=39325 RepID=A0A7J7NEZ1_9MAGN|nr:hypothetical protein GIB67_021874 [Kingdonia uniflora]
MATATMATAAGAAMILYYVLNRRLSSLREGDGDLSKSIRSGRRRRVMRRPAQAPATWFEAISTLSETLRFMYSETLGKWPIGDLAFGINYLMRRQGNLQVASVYAGSSSIQLRGPEIMAELTHLLRLLTICMFFSKKPFPVFLKSAGFSQEDVLLQEPKARLLKPAFAIIRDNSSRCFLLLIRGTHSIKDTLTAVTGAVVPFHHSVLHEGGISNLVLGYAHCGMVAAARWIAKCCTPCLLKALGEYPDYNVKIVGHSLGGGTAALLTYILRERKDFSSSICVTFAPAACMTWDLAESGKHFITTIVNGADLVPTFSTASIDDLRSEVTASSWLNDLRDQVEHTRFLSVFYRSASALGSRLPSIASAKARVVGAGALLRPVSSSTQLLVTRSNAIPQAGPSPEASPSSSQPSWLQLIYQWLPKHFPLRFRILISRTNPWLFDCTEGSVAIFEEIIFPHVGKVSWSPRSKVQYANETGSQQGCCILTVAIVDISVVIKRAQNVARAVVRTRSSLSTWSCMGARRRNVGPVSNFMEERDDKSEGLSVLKIETESLVNEGVVEEVLEVDETVYGCSSGGGYYGIEEEEDELIQVEEDVITVENMSQGDLWYELERELCRQEEGKAQTQEDEEITEEENSSVLADAVVEVENNKTMLGSSLNEESSEIQQRFYPPGRIMHIVSVPQTQDDDNNCTTEEHVVGIYETPRNLYSKLQLSRTMINDHYMPMYKKMMELLITQLQKDEEDCKLI